MTTEHLRNVYHRGECRGTEHRCEGIKPQYVMENGTITRSDGLCISPDEESKAFVIGYLTGYHYSLIGVK